MKVWRVFLVISLFVVPANAAGSFQLEVDGARLGIVKSVEGGEENRPLTIAFGEVTPALSTLVSGFADGRPLATKKLTLTDGITIKRSQDARLMRVRLPAIGGGGAPDVALSFAALPLVASPWISAKTVSLPAAGSKIADARVDVGAGIRVAKLSALEITQSSGKGVVNEITIEGEPGSLPAMSSWAKSKAPRAIAVDYVDADVKTVIKLRLEGCGPRAFVSTPATLTVACASIHGQ